MDNTSQSGLYRSACAECHRRKQKCNREWPCNHCQKRKVADKCRFVQPNTVSSPSDSLASSSNDKKRARSHDEESAVAPDFDHSDDSDDTQGLEAMGYAAGPLLESLTLGTKEKKPLNEIKWVDADTCPQLKHALDILPTRPQMDALVQSFFNNINFHYYIIYPPMFLQEYQIWWDRKSQNRPLSLQWTILLVMVCACAAQHLDADMKPFVEVELGEASDKLSKDYHEAAQDLARVIPVGHCHILNLQYMLHSIYWFKAEARFVEAWHVIAAAVREAHELGLHRIAAAEDMSEFDKEMRRRVWCVLDCWDWQFASGLGRPTIIDHTDINVEPPSLTLENLTPSPLLHMKLQSELVTDLARRWGAPKNITTIDEIREYKIQIEEWIDKFPPVYNVNSPDTSKDHIHTWIMFHRFYIHTMAYLMILNPMRPHMAKVYNKSSTEDELKLRADAVYYSIKNLDTTTRWAEHVSPKDGRFHFIIFSLFDTATVLSTAVIKDEDGTIPNKDDIIDAIDNAVALLRRLKAISKTAKTSYCILVKMVQRVPRPNTGRDVYRKKQRMAPAASASPAASGSSYRSAGMSHSSPNAHLYVQGSESQGSSPSNFAGSDSVGAGSTPQSNYTSYDVHEKHENYTDSHASHTSHTTSYQGEEHMQPHATFNDHINLDAMAVPPSVGVDGLIQTGAVLEGLSGQPDPNLVGMVPPATYADYHVPGMQMNYGFENITEDELGEFTNLWDWRSLNLDFINSR